MDVIESQSSGANSIRVLIVAPSLDIIGGQSRQAVRLMEALRQDPSLKIGFVAHNPRLPGITRHLQRVKYLRTVLTTLYQWLLLFLNIPRYDIVHIFSASYYSYLLAAAPAILISRLFGKRCVINYRSGEAEDHLANWHLTAIPIIKLANRIVTPSGYLVDVFARFGLKAQAIYNIVELDRFPYREREQLRPVFLVTRLLEPLYNVACVLRAFALIQERFPEAKLTVGGDGFLRPDLEELARQLGLRNTEFIGFVPFNKMPELYNETDIYLTATDIDNMPSSITECMASGVPVVTSDAGGIPYIVTNEETCLMIPRNDHQAMADAAFRLLSDPALAKRITRNARESSKKFMSPGVRAEWVRLYRELLPEKFARGESHHEARMLSQSDTKF